MPGRFIERVSPPQQTVPVTPPKETRVVSGLAPTLIASTVPPTDLNPRVVVVRRGDLGMVVSDTAFTVVGVGHCPDDAAGVGFRFLGLVGRVCEVFSRWVRVGPAGWP